MTHTKDGTTTTIGTLPAPALIQVMKIDTTSVHHDDDVLLTVDTSACRDDEHAEQVALCALEQHLEAEGRTVTGVTRGRRRASYRLELHNEPWAHAPEKISVRLQEVTPIDPLAHNLGSKIAESRLLRLIASR